MLNFNSGPAGTKHGHLMANLGRPADTLSFVKGTKWQVETQASLAAHILLGRPHSRKLEMMKCENWGTQVI